MTRAYFSCDCESVMNDLFSTFSRYNGDLSLSKAVVNEGSNNLHMLFWFLPLCCLGLFRGFTFWHEHAFTFPPSLALPCHAFTVYFHFFSILFCLMLSPFPFALCKYRQFKTCQWWFFFSFFFSSLPHFWGHSFMAPTSTIVKPSRPQKLYNFSSAFKVIGASNM